MYTFTSRRFSIQIVGDMGPGCLRKVFVGVVVFVVADVVDMALTAAPVHTLSLCNTQQPVASSSQPAASITPQTPFPHSHLSAYPVPPFYGAATFEVFILGGSDCEDVFYTYTAQRTYQQQC